MFHIRTAVPEDYYDLKECMERHGKKLELSSETVLMTATEDGTFAGMGAYTAAGEEATLTAIYTEREEDEQMPFFLAKACLNKMDLDGVRRVRCSLAESEALLKRLGFCRSGEEFTLDLEGYFEAPCSHQNESGSAQR